MSADSETFLAPTTLTPVDSSIYATMSSDLGNGEVGNSLGLVLARSQHDSYGVRYVGDGLSGSWQLVRSVDDVVSVLTSVPASQNHPGAERWVTLSLTADTLSVEIDRNDIGLSYTVPDGLT
eukprot:UN07037